MCERRVSRASTRAKRGTSSDQSDWWDEISRSEKRSESHGGAKWGNRVGRSGELGWGEVESPGWGWDGEPERAGWTRGASGAVDATEPMTAQRKTTAGPRIV